LKQLIEIYALRTQRLSEAIAVLGGHVTAQKPIAETLNEIKNLNRLLERAAADLFAFVGRRPEESANEYRDAFGMIVMCMHCHRTRRSARVASGEEWEQVQAFMDQRPEKVSDGLCPQCSERHYPKDRQWLS
jgi:hypothetical protein